MKYELKKTEDGREYVIRENTDGTFSEIPADPANSDYQAYLNPVEHLTEIPTPDEA